MSVIIITLTDDSGYNVLENETNKYADQLSYEEALGLVAQMIAPTESNPPSLYTAQVKSEGQAVRLEESIDGDLNFIDAMGVVAVTMMPLKRRALTWLKTADEHCEHTMRIKSPGLTGWFIAPPRRQTARRLKAEQDEDTEPNGPIEKSMSVAVTIAMIAGLLILFVLLMPFVSYVIERYLNWAHDFLY